MNEIKQLLKGDTPVKWLFYGDSITHGARHTFGDRDYTELFSERVRTELGRPWDIVIKTAISGNTTRELLKEFEWRCAQFKPDVVFVMIGMNDCSEAKKLPADEFEKNLHELVDQLESIGSRTVMQTTCPILPKSAPDREVNFDEFMNRIRRVAQGRNLPLIDHEKHWQENIASHYFWMNNAFHPNGEGHRAFANLLYKELDIWDDNAASCRLFVP